MPQEKDTKPSLKRGIQQPYWIRYNSIFTALERAKNNYIRFSLSLQTLKDSIDKSPQMQQLLADLHNYHNYSQALTTHIEQIQGQVRECNT